MAITVTSRVTGSVSGAEAQTNTTTAFTPASTVKLYVLAFAVSATTGIDLTIASNTGGLSFGTPIFQDTQNSADSEFGRIALFEATVAASPGSMTVTLDAGATTKTAWISYTVFDMAGSLGTVQLKSGQIIGSRGAGATGLTVAAPSGTLPASATSGNLTAFLGGRNNDTAGLATVPAAGGFSSLADGGNTVFVAPWAFTSTTFTGTSTTTTDQGGQTSCWSTILAEFEEAASASINPLAPRWDYRSPILRM